IWSSVSCVGIGWLAVAGHNAGQRTWRAGTRVSFFPAGRQAFLVCRARDDVGRVCVRDSYRRIGRHLGGRAQFRRTERDLEERVERVELGGASGFAGAFTVSQTGLVAYQTGATDLRSQLVWCDRTGKQLSMVGGPVDQ